MSVLDTEVDGSNPGSSMLFPWARDFIRIASVDSAVKWVPGGDCLVKDVQCYELFEGIALKNHAFSFFSLGFHSIHVNPSLHSRTSRLRSGRRQKTWWCDVISIQRWQGIGLGCHLYWLVLNQQPMLRHSEHRFSVKRGRGLEETKIFSSCGRLWVCSSGCWNIMYHRFSWMLPLSWYRSPHLEGHQWSPPDVLHLSTDFSCHHPSQRTGYDSLFKEICSGVGWETLTFKMKMHCSVL